MNDIFEVPISTGTLVNHVNDFASKSEPVLNEIKEQVKQGETIVQARKFKVLLRKTLEFSGLYY